MILRDKHGRGACVSCGYFGKRRIDLRDAECYGVSVYERESGDMLPVEGRSVIPWCFVNQCNLLEEIETTHRMATKPESVLQAIKKQRNCPGWYPFREFATPKEQWDESIMLAMEQRREKFERDMEQERQRFELELSKISESIQRDSTETSRRVLWLTWILAIWAALQFAATLAMLIWPR